MSKTKSFIVISRIATTVMLLAISITIMFAWYTSTSNDATFDSDEFMSVSQGYAGHFSTEEHYWSADDIYENDDTVVTKTTVIPGKIVYYAFLFEVKNQNELLSSYVVDTLLVYGSSSANSYHGVNVGNYNSFLYNTGVVENSCHLYLMQKLYDSEEHSYYYTKSGNYLTTASTGVNRLSNTDNRNEEANVSLSINLDLPQIDSFPTNVDNDEKVYFMLYIPIWYQDIEINQNQEMDSYLKIVSTVLVPNE